MVQKLPTNDFGGTVCGISIYSVVLCCVVLYCIIFIIFYYISVCNYIYNFTFEFKRPLESLQNNILYIYSFAMIPKAFQDFFIQSAYHIITLIVYTISTSKFSLCLHLNSPPSLSIQNGFKKELQIELPSSS